MGGFSKTLQVGFCSGKVPPPSPVGLYESVVGAVLARACMARGHKHVFHFLQNLLFCRIFFYFLCLWSFLVVLFNLLLFFVVCVFCAPPKSRRLQAAAGAGGALPHRQHGEGAEGEGDHHPGAPGRPLTAPTRASPLQRRAAPRHPGRPREDFSSQREFEMSSEFSRSFCSGCFSFCCLRIDIHAHASMYIYTYKYIYINIYDIFCLYIRIHTYVYMCVYKYIHTCIPTYVCMYIFIYMSLSLHMYMLCIYWVSNHISIC